MRAAWGYGQMRSRVNEIRREEQIKSRTQRTRGLSPTQGLHGASVIMRCQELELGFVP